MKIYVNNGLIRFKLNINILITYSAYKYLPILSKMDSPLKRKKSIFEFITKKTMTLHKKEMNKFNLDKFVTSIVSVQGRNVYINEKRANFRDLNNEIFGLYSSASPFQNRRWHNNICQFLITRLFKMIRKALEDFKESHLPILIDKWESQFNKYEEYDSFTSSESSNSHSSTLENTTHTPGPGESPEEKHRSIVTSNGSPTPMSPLSPKSMQKNSAESDQKAMEEIDLKNSFISYLKGILQEEFMMINTEESYLIKNYNRAKELDYFNRISKKVGMRNVRKKRRHQIPDELNRSFHYHYHHIFHAIDHMTKKHPPRRKSCQCSGCRRKLRRYEI